MNVEKSTTKSIEYSVYFDLRTLKLFGVFRSPVTALGHWLATELIHSLYEDMGIGETSTGSI